MSVGAVKPSRDGTASRVAVEPFCAGCRWRGEGDAVAPQWRAVVDGLRGGLLVSVGWNFAGAGAQPQGSFPMEAAKEPLSRCMRAHERRTAVIAEAAAALAAAHPLLPRLKVCVCVCLSVCAPVPLSLSLSLSLCLCVPVHIHVSTHAACMHAY